MKSDKPIAIYRRLREQPMWRLLAASNGPIILGLLQTHLYEAEGGVAASLLHERIERDLETLRSRGCDLPQTAQAYVAAWLAEGWLERRFPPGASEEQYELSTAATAAIRFASGLEQPRATATESRLALVIRALTGLSEDTDTDKVRRIARLRTEQARIERDIGAIEKGNMRVLPRAVALERAREIISLADELAGDFRRVRDEFERLNRGLRASIMDQDGNRGDVLDALFAGIDLIGESEAGRTFNAFWRLLTDPQQSATLDDALDSIVEREFVKHLDARERRFLIRLPQTLLEQGGMVHESLQHFARSLKHFVQSREYLEQRRINQLVREAQRTALVLKDNIRATEIALTLMLTSSRLRSVSQWRPFDPTLQGQAGGMRVGDALPIGLEAVSELVAQSEIDFRSLKVQIRSILKERGQVSIGGVLRRFPASQGLGTVVGLLALGSRHGVGSQQTETVSWTGADGQARRARIPTFYFIEERAHELA